MCNIICTLLQTDHTSTLSLNFLQAGLVFLMPSPTNSIKALNTLHHQQNMDEIRHLGILPATTANSTSYPQWMDNQNWPWGRSSALSLGRSGITLATLNYRLNGLSKGDKHHAYTPPFALIYNVITMLYRYL